MYKLYTRQFFFPYTSIKVVNSIPQITSVQIVYSMSKLTQVTKKCHCDYKHNRIKYCTSSIQLILYTSVINVYKLSQITKSLTDISNSDLLMRECLSNLLDLRQ